MERRIEKTYAQLLNNGTSTEDGSRLEGQHRLLALLQKLAASFRGRGVGVADVERQESLAIGVEGVVVVFNELLCNHFLISASLI